MKSTHTHTGHVSASDADLTWSQVKKAAEHVSVSKKKKKKIHSCEPKSLYFPSAEQEGKAFNTGARAGASLSLPEDDAFRNKRLVGGGGTNGETEGPSCADTEHIY